MKLKDIASRAMALALTTLLIAPATFSGVASAQSAPLPPLTVTTGPGRVATYPSPSGSLISTDTSVVDTAAVTAWVGKIAPSMGKGAIDAKRWVDRKKKMLKFTSSKDGWTLSAADKSAAVVQICDQLRKEAAESTPTSPVLTLKTTAVKPKVGNFKQTILVRLGQRKIYLYGGTKVVKTYRCAVGQPRYPTPTGIFWIGKKVKNPSWTNGGMQWAANMPSYIGPGVNNPLGTRAMYVYGKNGDTGVRFHGVPASENSSIGHAASHGCLRMHRKDVEKFYKQVALGTGVFIIK